MDRNGSSSFLSRIWHLYADGFRDLSDSGRRLWIIILIKLFILFFILKMFLMPDVLKKNFSTDEQRSRHVLENLTNGSGLPNQSNPKS
jgi:hypothetical protein